jgi:FkbM family methyltransferase
MIPMFDPRFANNLRRLFGYRFPPTGSQAMRWIIAHIPRHIECEIFPGIEVPLDMNDLTQRATFWQGDRFEKPTAQIMEAYGRGASRFFDIGSNYGFFSYWMMYKHSQISVHAFEPNPLTFELLQKIRTKNQLARFHPQHLGLAEAPGVLQLHAGEVDSGHSTFTDHPQLTNTPVAEVEVTTFDLWAKAQPNPLSGSGDWIAKIDVEGFERKVLQGMRDHLSRRAFRLLVVEMNDYTLHLAGTTRTPFANCWRNTVTFLCGKCRRAAGGIWRAWETIFLCRPELRASREGLAQRGTGCLHRLTYGTPMAACQT